MRITGRLSLADDDAALVLRTLKGDNAAFGELYDRYAALVRAICHDNAQDFSRTQDLTQEVFLRAYAKLEMLKEPDRFGPWLVSIARNVGREFRRGCYRDRLTLVGLDPPEKPETNDDDGEFRLDLLRQAMQHLGEQERLALNVYYLQNEDVEKAQKLLGVSRSGFYRLLDKAKKKLEKQIRRIEDKKA
jgi:RNA polymerase sigma-70 factor, ECF subfamily